MFPIAPRSIVPVIPAVIRSVISLSFPGPIIVNKALTMANIIDKIIAGIYDLQ